MKKKLRPYKPVKPLAPGQQLAPYRSPDIPAAKFKHVPGQLAMDFASDDPDVLIEPDGAQ